MTLRGKACLLSADCGIQAIEVFVFWLYLQFVIPKRSATLCHAFYFFLPWQFDACSKIWIFILYRISQFYGNDYESRHVVNTHTQNNFNFSGRRHAVHIFWLDDTDRRASVHCVESITLFHCIQRTDKLEAQKNHIIMSIWFVHMCVSLLVCSLESSRLARDISSSSPTDSRHIRDKIETSLSRGMWCDEMRPSSSQPLCDLKTVWRYTLGISRPSIRSKNSSTSI